jgi:uncharacterized membrane protein
MDAFIDSILNLLLVVNNQFDSPFLVLNLSIIAGAWISCWFILMALERSMNAKEQVVREPDSK